MSLDSEYFKVPLIDFTEVSPLPVDIFYEVAPEKIQKIGQKGSAYSLKQLYSTVKKDSPWLLLKKEDYRFYVGFTIAHGSQPLIPTTEILQKLHDLNLKIEALLKQYVQDGLRIHEPEAVSNTLLNALHLALENPITFKLLEKIEITDGPSLHFLAVAVWTQVLARNLGWSGEPTAFRVVLCALFHDVGSNENIEALLRRPLKTLSETELRILESHTIRGRDILSSIAGMPSEVITVAHQHHEAVNGEGYPQKLFLDGIHPIARLIALVNRFYEVYSNTRKDKSSVKQILDIFRKDHANFDLRFFKTLEEVLNTENDPQEKK